ncbi:MAG: hypothetical protein OHK0039_27620 [Bacteroidia bacterium]
MREVSLIQILLPVSVLLLFVLLLEWSTYRGLAPVIDHLRNHTWRQVWRSLYAANSVLLVGALVFGVVAFIRRDASLYRPVSLAFGVVVMLLLPKLVFLAVSLGGWVVEGIIRLLSSSADAAEVAVASASRRRFVGQVGLGLAAIPFFGVLHGLTRGKYAYTVHRQTLRFPDLPAAFHGFTIAQISDIHAGSFDDAAAVQRGVDMVNALGADLIAFTGDLVNNVASEIEPWIDTFARLRAPFGVFSITGNHDYGEYVRWDSEEARAADFRQLVAHHGRMGFRILMNEHVRIEKDGQTIDLLGVENWGEPPFPQHGDLEAALRDSTSDFRVLLSHDPTHWDAQVRPHNQPVHLTLSGHTHGMQFGVEIAGWKWSPVKYRYPRWAGLYEEAGKYLYVNRGFGFIGFPARVGIWPEITLITLERG